MSDLYDYYSMQATIKCPEAPVEKYQTGCCTYNIQAVSFTPEQLVEEMKKHTLPSIIDRTRDRRFVGVA